MSGPPLDDRMVDLWYVLSEEISDAGLFEEYRRRLPSEEVEQEQRFVFEKSRLEFLVTRMLVRTTLSHYTGDEPEVWQFTRNAYGKPSVSGPERLPLEFNLSHASGLVVCAVTLGRRVGVDVENTHRAAGDTRLASRYFAAAEVEALERLSREERRAAFFRFWTLKEAFIKAQGMGLSIPLNEFAISLSEDRPPAVSFGKPDGGDPSQWQFAQLGLDSRYQMAVAIRLPASEKLSVRVRRTLPLRWQAEARVLPFDRANRWTL